jgi:hypothetical protein
VLVDRIGSARAVRVIILCSLLHYDTIAGLNFAHVFYPILCCMTVELGDPTGIHVLTSAEMEASSDSGVDVV